MEKKNLRKHILGKMNSLNAETHERLSAQIVGRLFEDPAFKNAGTIGVTVSNFPEVDTIGLIRRAWQEGKRVAVPKCLSNPRRMEFYALTDFSQLETVYMNLREPKAEETVYVPPEEISLLVVPGVAFDRDGFRVGFGGGFYDRYLSGYLGETRSLAFDLQIVEKVPVEVHDVPVGGIYTESGFIRTEAVQ